jgi:hypothetical protein
VKSQSTVANLRSDVHCGNLHNLRLYVAVVNESVKYDFLFNYESSKKQNCICYKIVIRFIFFPKHRGFDRQKMVSDCFYNARTEVITAVLMNIEVSWDVTCR